MMQIQFQSLPSNHGSKSNGVNLSHRHLVSCVIVFLAQQCRESLLDSLGDSPKLETSLLNQSFRRRFDESFRGLPIPQRSQFPFTYSTYRGSLRSIKVEGSESEGKCGSLTSPFLVGP